MRAAVLEAPRSIVVREVAEPDRAPAEVLVHVEVAGLCGSDLALFAGRRAASYPLILGHEAVGRRADDGTRVVIEPNIPCGACSVCKRGHANVCPRKRSLGVNAPGVFAERVAVAPEFIHPVPPEVDVLDAVGLEPLAVAVHALRVGNVAAGDSVAVVGCGIQGLLLVQLALARRARVLAVDVSDAPLAAAAALGADTLRIKADAFPVDAESAWSPDIVFEAAGAPSALETALRMSTNGGTIVTVGLATEPIELLPLDFVRRGLTLVGSLIYDHPRDFACAIELVASGAIHPGRHVSAIAQLADAPAMLAGNAPGKTVFDIGGVLTNHTPPAAQRSVGADISDPAKRSGQGAQ